MSTRKFYEYSTWLFICLMLHYGPQFLKTMSNTIHITQIQTRANSFMKKYNEM